MKILIILLALTQFVSAQTPQPTAPATPKPSTTAVAAPAANPAAKAPPAANVVTPPAAASAVKPAAATPPAVAPPATAATPPAPEPNASTVTAMSDYKATSRYFMDIVEPFAIDLKSVATCKKKLVALCGESSFPRAGTFTMCLQKNYDKIKVDGSCEPLAHALVGANFLVWLARTSQNCDIYYQKCVMKLKPSTEEAFNRCMASDPTISPLCTKLVQDAVLNSYVTSQIYDYLKTSW